MNRYNFTENIHTHTYLCNHASGTMREYVERAVERGLKVLGFSDHSPYSFPDGYYSGFRMRPEKIDEYVDTLLGLREEFKDRIKIYIGYEAEYYPKHFRDFLDMINRRECDYLILGQHFTRNEYDGVHVHNPNNDIGVLREYVAQVCEAMRLGVFTYVNHPDMADFSGDMDIYLDAMNPICKTSVETDTPLEINLLGLGDGRSYPKKEFMKMAVDEGCKIVIGCDAHCVDAVADPGTMDEAFRFAEEIGAKPLEHITLRRPVLGS